MNYILIMTEGAVELAFVNILLERNLLKFKKEELLMEEIYNARQISGELIGYIQLTQPEDIITIYRVGDKLSDKLRIPKNILSSKISNKYDVSTLPEFEILFLLNEGLYDEFLKVKSSMKPSSFYKKYNAKYNKQTKFIKEYFEKMTNEEIVSLINLYVMKHGKAHKKNQLTLKDIISC